MIALLRYGSGGLPWNRSERLQDSDTIKDLTRASKSQIQLVGSNGALRWHANGKMATEVLRKITWRHAWVLKVLRCREVRLLGARSLNG